MCRIILALGKFDLSPLIDGLLLMAQDQNSIHELNHRKGLGTWQHPDGWGLAYLKDNQWQIEKSIKPVYQDEKINQFKNFQTNFALFHVRKQSIGKVALENTHPFQKENFVFCHNGTIRDQFETFPHIEGETESERFFTAILQQLPEKDIPQAIRFCFNKYPNCKGSNIVLTNPEKTFLAIRENVLPKHYTMYLHQTPESIIICSEPLKNLPELNWQSLEQNTILEINHQTLEITNH